jgi:phenylalanyl-tRNA synthetase beta chain
VRVVLSWLEEMVPLGISPTDRRAVGELASLLAELGMAPEAIEYVEAEAAGVVIGRVAEISEIEGAKRIRKVVVDYGSGQSEVVCGAWNFSEGDMVPLALPGARVAGLEGPLEARRVMGVLSQGMMCSGRELGISEDHSGIYVLGETAKLGADFAETYGLGPDVVFDLELPSDRGDLLSVLGVAREVAAKLGVALREPKLAELTALSLASEGSFEVRVEDPKLCRRFVACYIGNVKFGQAAPQLARRLRLAGLRPISNLVDYSNYVMVEMGQPTHPYDLAFLGGRGLVARAAKPGEVVRTLDGLEREVGPEDCVIVDGLDRPVGIGGVMGGAAAEISEATSEVLLEAAWFDPSAISRTSRRLGLRTEAAVRFERGCDPAAPEAAIARYVELVLAEQPSAKVGQLSCAGEARPGPRPLRLRLARASELLGTGLEAVQVSALLSKLGFKVSGKEVLHVEVPTWRGDVSREVDLVEEVGRLVGYDSLPRRLPRPPQVGTLSWRQKMRRELRRAMVGVGAYEAWTSSFVSESEHGALHEDRLAVALANPMIQEESLLRTSLLVGLAKAAARNLARGEEVVVLFELGEVFSQPKEGSVEEEEHLGFLAAGRIEGVSEAVRAWRAIERSLRLEAVSFEPPGSKALHPWRSARLCVGSDGELGWIGELHPEVAASLGLEGQRVGYLELSLARLENCPRRPRLIEVPSRFPPAFFDLAFLVAEDIPAARVEEALRRAGGGRLADLWLFDSYSGRPLPKGTRSLAWRLRLEAPDHTLSDEEISQVRGAMIEAVQAAGLGRLRG